MTLGFFSDFIHDHPSYDLEEALALVWDNYPDEWEEFWGIGSEFAPDHLDPDDWEAFQQLVPLAQRLGEAARTLVRPRRLPDRHLAMPEELRREAEDHREMVDDILEKLREILPPGDFRDVARGIYRVGPEARRAVFETAMQLQAWEHFPYSPRRLAGRMIRLLDYVSRVESPMAQAYLGRVAECYIREMRPEFAVMARAVVGAALESVLPEDDAKEVMDRPKGRLGLSAHLEAARICGVLDQESYQAARRVKEAGDDAAHVAPDLVSDPDDILENLIVVLQQLHGLESE